MPSADQVPVRSTHSKMPWPMWVVLIAGSTGAALRAVRPPNRYVTPDISSAVPLRRECDGLPVALTCGHHGPRHACNLVGERNRSNFGRSTGQQPREPGPMPRAMDLGIADYGERTGCEQAAQIAIALLTDTTKLVLAPTRVLLRDEADPGREVSSRSESPRIS